MLRRLHKDQPDSFAFTPDNQRWAEAQITKYPEGRQASAIIPLLWRAQEQEGWLSRPAIEYVAAMLGMANIRAFEVASFYFMFQLQPVGSVAHIQVCGTTSCMICGAEDLVAVCKEKIAPNAHEISANGKFSWEEVECLGACSNAPMAQIGKDYYEDLTAETLSNLIDELDRGAVPLPGPQNGRYSSEPLGGLTSLMEQDSGRTAHNASAQRAADLKDTVKRIDGTEVPLITPWLGKASKGAAKPAEAAAAPAEKPAQKSVQKSEDVAKPAAETEKGTQPQGLEAPRAEGADDLKEISGVGPVLEELLHSLGYFHFDQIAAWSSAEVAWVDENLKGFKGRVSRDNWVSQARTLEKKGQT